MPILHARASDEDCIRDSWGRVICGEVESRWNSWGRYVAAVIIIVFILSLICLFSIIRVRRRQRMGYAPRPGTGWFANKFAGPNLRGGQGQAPGVASTYPMQPQHPPPPPNDYYHPAPPYTPNPTFEQQQTGVTGGVDGGSPYNGGSPYYPPPQGPPPRDAYLNGQMPPQSPMGQQYTGTSIQSNNPYFQPPSNPPPAHLAGDQGKQ